MIAACCLHGCLPEGEEPYTGSGPTVSGMYQLDQIETYEGDCNDFDEMRSLDGYFKLEREASDTGDFIAWYECNSEDTCELTHKRNESFYEPRPETWKRVSLWAVEGVGECILRNETATAKLDGDTLTVDVRTYRETLRGSGSENCVQSKAASIATSLNCATREVTTATYLGSAR
ncbi:MAG: hypothetical protein ACQEVA_07935 [Myxococcota bacterium]